MPWYDDLTVSIGTTADLDKREPPDFYSRRFFVIAQARHALWPDHFAVLVKDVADPSKCDEVKREK